MFLNFLYFFIITVTTRENKTRTISTFRSSASTNDGGCGGKDFAFALSFSSWFLQWLFEKGVGQLNKTKLFLTHIKMAVDVEQLYKSFGELADAKENAKQVSVSSKLRPFFYNIAFICCFFVLYSTLKRTKLS